jgi:hypothetical protein
MKLQELGAASMLVLLAAAYTLLQLLIIIQEVVFQKNTFRYALQIFFSRDSNEKCIVLLPRPITKLRNELIEWSRTSGFGLSINGSFKKKVKESFSSAELASIILSLKFFLEEKGYVVEASLKDLLQSTPLAEVWVTERPLKKLKNKLISLLMHGRWEA